MTPQDLPTDGDDGTDDTKTDGPDLTPPAGLDRRTTDGDADPNVNPVRQAIETEVDAPGTTTPAQAAGIAKANLQAERDAGDDEDKEHPFAEFENIADACGMSVGDLAVECGFAKSTPGKWKTKGTVPKPAVMAARYIRSLRTDDGPLRIEVAMSAAGPVIRPRGPDIEVETVYSDAVGAIVEIVRL